MTEKSNPLFRMVLAAMFLALALILPFFTGNIPQIGQALCPMHLPVLLCGFFCGPWYALAVGFIAPLLRFALFGMPPLIPTGIAMCFELAAYGTVAALLYRALPRKKPFIWLALLGAMVAGRVIWGFARLALFGLTGSPFGWSAFLSGAVLGALPGIALQLVFIPLLVLALQKFTVAARS